MARHVIYTSLSEPEIRARVRLLVAIITGGAADQHDIARGFKMRLAYGFFEKVYKSFLIKMRGGTDECGISWPRLSKKYLAYGRRFGRGEKAELKRQAGLGKGNHRSPGGKDGLLTAAQEKRWWAVYRRNLAWLAAHEGIGAAKGKAAAIAWSTIKKEGAKTKLEVYGNRDVDILRDTGQLLNSLTPGFLSEAGPGASYSLPEGQLVIDRPGELVCGSNVPQARYAQGTDDRPGRRRIFPRADEVPQVWKDDLADLASGGIVQAVLIIFRG